MREQNTYINLLHDNLNWEKKQNKTKQKSKWSSNWIKDSDMFIQWHTTQQAWRIKKNIDKSQKYYTK